MGTNTKNAMPMAKKDSLTNSQTGVRVIMSHKKNRATKVIALLRGSRHSWKLRQRGQYDVLGRAKRI